MLYQLGRSAAHCRIGYDRHRRQDLSTQPRPVKGRGPLHTVSAWATGQQLVLGEEAVCEKSNEIITIPLLLQRLEIAGAIVTIDAMGTQAQITQTILNGGGDYVLALKQNRPATFTEVEAPFSAPPQALAIDVHKTIDDDHGRIETRSYSCRRSQSSGLVLANRADSCSD